LLNFLRERGLEQGSIIYTQLPLVPANWLCYLAAIKGGFIVIPAATTLTVEDIAYRFGQTLPDAIITDFENAGKIDEAIEENGYDIPVKLATDRAGAGWTLFEDALADQKSSAEAADTRPDDPLFYFFTSGTTGMPKVVTHTHFSYPIGHLTTASWIGLRHGDVHYNISQPGWAKFAWSSFFAPWAVGATIFAKYSESFSASEHLKAMEQYGITTFCAPPTALRMLIQCKLEKYDLKLRQCVAAGEPLSPDIIESWKKGTGMLIRDGYGQTESTCMVGNLPNADLKYGSMGKPTFLYDIVIADDDGTLMPETEVGNICLKFSEDKINGLFIGYEGDKGKEEDVFKHDLYYTGDKAYYDEEGYIWFVGRDDDVIKASDYRIGPFEVESVLSDYDAVVEAAVVASPHELRGNVVKAFLIMKENTDYSEALAQELFDYTGERLAVYKIPRIIEFITEFPKTVSGKIRRVELRSDEEVHRQKNERRENEFFHSKYQ
jgi:acetyl-CoA synthetase